MKLFKILTFILFLSFGAIAAGKPNKSRIDSLEARLRQLENYKENIDTYSKASTLNIKNELEKEVKDQLKDIEDSKKILYLLIALGLPTTLWGMYMGFWGIKKKANKLIDERLETIVEQKREELIRLVETQAFDTKLRNTKKLLVISGTEEQSESLKRLMDKLGFKHVIYRIAGGFDTIPEHDLMVFNNIGGNLGQDNIDRYMQESSDEDLCFVAYTDQKINVDARLNFSNSRFTLYHSLLSTLKYADILKAVNQ